MGRDSENGPGIITEGTTGNSAGPGLTDGNFTGNRAKKIIVGKAYRQNERRKTMNIEKIKAGYERLKACISSDTCEKMDCAYFTRPDELSEVLSFLGNAISKAEEQGKLATVANMPSGLDK